MISICVGIRNRSEQFLNCLVKSLSSCKKNDFLELSIVDCHSDDVAGLSDLIRKKWNGKIKYTNSSKPFTRSSSLNDAVKQTINDLLFLCDADMLLPHDFVLQFLRNVDQNKIWFPICFNLNDRAKPIIDKQNGVWRPTGHGMVGITKFDYIRVGGLDEIFNKWGGEDNEFFQRCSRNSKIVRERCKGLFHVWHQNDAKFKNKYYRT